MNNVKYNYSSTQIYLPEDLSQEIIGWGQKNIPDSIIFTDPNEIGYGREDEIHVTVLYGLQTNDTSKVKKLAEKQKPFMCRLGKISIFKTNSNFDVLKIEVKGIGIYKLNKLFVDNFKTINSYPIYRPHVTIAYLEKGYSAKYLGDKTFVNKKFKIDGIVFSPKIGEKTTIKFLED